MFSYQAKSWDKSVNISEYRNSVLASINKQFASVDEELKDYQALVKGGGVWESLNDIGTGNTFGRTLGNDYQLLAHYINNPVVHACISKNAEAVVSTAFGVYTEDTSATSTKRRKKNHKKLTRRQKKNLSVRFHKDVEGYEQVLDHPLLDLMDNEDEDLSIFDFIRLTSTDVQIYGRAYWHLERNSPGDATEIPVGIRYLKPYYVGAIRDVEGDVLGYFYTNVYATGTTGTNKRYDTVWLEKEDVVDFRWPSPSDPYGGGDSPLRSAFTQVTLASEYVEYQATLLKNRGRIDGILTIDKDVVSPEEQKNLEKQFNNKYKGSGNGGIMVADKALKFTPVTYSPDDFAGMQVLQTLKEAICNVLHIPLPLMDNDPNRAGLEAALEQWRIEGVKPLIELIECKINKYLATLFDDGSIFAFDNPIPEDEQFELAEQTQQDTVWVAALQYAPTSLTPNEIRDRLGLDPIDGGDELTEPKPAPILPQPPAATDDTGAIPDGNKPQAPTAAATPENAPAAGGKALEAVLRLNEAVSAGNLDRATAINVVSAFLSLEQAEAKKLVGYKATEQAAIIAARCLCDGCKPPTKDLDKAAIVTKEPVTRDELSTEAKLKRVMAGWYQDLGKEAVKAIKQKSVSGIVTKDDTGNVPTEFVDLQDWIDNLKGTEDDLAYKVKPLIQIEAQKTADDKTNVLARAGASPDAFDVVPQQVHAATDKRAYRFAKSTLDTTSKGLTDVLSGIKELIENGTLEGDSVGTLTAAVSDFFENAADYQAERIARTEVQAAVHSGQVIAAKASGIVKSFSYLVSSDACPVCQEYAGTEVGIDDYNDSGAVDAEGAVPLHPNCSCSLTENLDLGDDSDDSDSEDNN